MGFSMTLDPKYSITNLGFNKILVLASSSEGIIKTPRHFKLRSKLKNTRENKF